MVGAVDVISIVNKLTYESADRIVCLCLTRFSPRKKQASGNAREDIEIDSVAQQLVLVCGVSRARLGL